MRQLDGVLTRGSIFILLCLAAISGSGFAQPTNRADVKGDTLIAVARELMGAARYIIAPTASGKWRGLARRSVVVARGGTVQRTGPTGGVGISGRLV